MHRVIDWMYLTTGKRDEVLALYLQQHYEQKHRTYHNLSHLVRELLPDDQAMYTPAPYMAPKLEINW